MAETHHQKLYENIMRGAEERMRIRALHVLERQRELLRKHNAKLNSIRLSKADEEQCLIEQIDLEISNLSARMERTSRIEKRIELKAAIVHLKEVRERITSSKRKPPEAGIAVPAVPPKGPQPKQGGAAVRLEFD